MGGGGGGGGAFCVSHISENKWVDTETSPLWVPETIVSHESKRMEASSLFCRFRSTVKTRLRESDAAGDGFFSVSFTLSEKLLLKNTRTGDQWSCQMKVSYLQIIRTLQEQSFRVLLKSGSHSFMSHIKAAVGVLKNRVKTERECENLNMYKVQLSSKTVSRPPRLVHDGRDNRDIFSNCFYSIK